MKRTIEYPSPLTPNDVIQLNVGGRHYTALRSTLVIQPGLLQNMFYGHALRGEPVRDDQNRVFLDRDPAPFACVLTYLRTGSIEVPQDASVAQCSAEIAYFFDNSSILPPCLDGKLKADTIPIVDCWIDQFASLLPPSHEALDGNQLQWGTPTERWCINIDYYNDNTIALSPQKSDGVSTLDVIENLLCDASPHTLTVHDIADALLARNQTIRTVNGTFFKTNEMYFVITFKCDISK